MAAWRRASSLHAARISTSVPNRGRARLTSSRSLAGDCNCISCQQTAYPLGEVLARERRAADVLNVAPDCDGVAVVAPDELRAPVCVANLSAVRLAVFEN